jgi:hypothetical protein
MTDPSAFCSINARDTSSKKQIEDLHRFGEVVENASNDAAAST